MTDASGIPRVVVFNPGQHPGPKWTAGALASGQLLQRYFTTGTLSHRELRRLASLPLARRLVSASARRVLPPSVATEAMRRTAIPADLASIATARVGRLGESRRLLNARNRKLGRALLRSQDLPSPPGLVYLPTDTRSGLSQALLERGVPYALYTPLPYGPYCLDLMDQERERNPQWARFVERDSGAASSGAADQQEVELEVRNAALIIANSGFTQRSFTLGGVEVPVASFPLAVERSYFLGGPGRPSDARRGKLRAIYTGQVNQRKGLSYLFEALDALELRSAVHLDVYGADLQGLEHALRAAYPHVGAAFHGRVNQDRLAQALCSSHVFVFPTLLDGFGNSLIEAVSGGLPVIATNRCGASDLGLFPDAGIEVEAGSAEALRSALVCLVEDEERRRAMARHAEELDLGTWEAYGDATAARLREAVQHVRPHL